MPRVTVVMATYNWSTVLPYSIGSVLDQTFTDFELLVIGDGCTDDSEQVVSAIADPRVRWIGLQRSGHQSEPNNEGIRRARGEYIAYLGHDDLWLPHHLTLLVAALDAGADMVHSVAAAVGDEVIRPMTPVPTCMAHRRSVIERIGGWRDYRDVVRLPQADLWTRARAAGVATTFIRRCTAVKLPAAWRRDVYRQRPCHEQAAWLARIRSEHDLETTLLVDMALGLAKPAPMWIRLPRLLLRPWRWPALSRFLRKGGLVRGYLKYKGVAEVKR